jgi:hypothetical protein
MDNAGAEEHKVVLATRLNGEVTFAPLAGLATTIFDAAGAAHTVMFRSTWLLVPLPQHFT